MIRFITKLNSIHSTIKFEFKAGESFNFETQSGRAGVNKPFVANVKELQVSYLRWLKENKPSKLECTFEARMKEEGDWILWTPLYRPKVQPIEIYWANG